MLPLEPVSLSAVARPYREVPPPLEGNDRLIAAVGTAIWGVALTIVVLLRNHLPHSSQWWIWVCVAGVGLGIFGIVYVPVLQRSRERRAQRNGRRQG